MCPRVVLGSAFLHRLLRNMHLLYTAFIRATGRLSFGRRIAGVEVVFLVRLHNRWLRRCICSSLHLLLATRDGSSVVGTTVILWTSRKVKSPVTLGRFRRQSENLNISRYIRNG